LPPDGQDDNAYDELGTRAKNNLLIAWLHSIATNKGQQNGMWDASTTEGDRPLRRSMLRFVASAAIVLLGLGLVGCLFWHPELTSAGIGLVPHQTPAGAAATPNAGRASSAPVAASASATLSTNLTAGQQPAAAVPVAAVPSLAMPTTGTADEQLDAMMGQLQSMQSNLQAMTQELDRRYPAAEPAPGAMDLASALAEMQRLNQIMQPLMEQIEVATQSGRPASEIAAMRAQMSEIHHRLSELMTAVESARAADGITR
jgi:hypothetical protein